MTVLRTAAASLMALSLAVGCQDSPKAAEVDTQPPPAVAEQPAAKPAKRKRGIVGRKAPAWKVGQWFNVAAGHDAPEVAALRGKVVYLYFFQSW